MAILTLQRRSRELGRIRIGQVVTGSNGKTRPEKLDRFRLTSASRELLDKVAALYGGDVREWQPQGGGVAAWEVVTTSTRLPVLVPPQPVSQFFESWAGGGCQRRCDGIRELLTDAPCLCSPDPAERECKPTTRLNVVLRDVEGVGVWRLESHGYYSATELPEVADFLATAQRYVPAWLMLEERVVKRDGKTRRFIVPGLEVDITPVELMSGKARPVATLESNGTPAIEAASAKEVTAPAPRDDLVSQAVATQEAAKPAGEISATWRDAIAECVANINQAAFMDLWESAKLTERDNDALAGALRVAGAQIKAKLAEYEQTPEPEPEGRRAIEKHLFALLGEGGVRDGDEDGRGKRLRILSRLTNRVPVLTTSTALTDIELGQVLAVLLRYQRENRLAEELETLGRVSEG